jgi:uncharacterized membrane protein
MSAAQQDSDQAADDRLLHRLLFFTDAVFAIVLTLLVLELRPPEAHQAATMGDALAGMGDHFTSFGMSFALVAVFWAAHMNTLRRLSHFDWPTAWANFALLAPVCLMPFASSLLGEGRFGPGAWGVYAWVMIAASAANMVLWLTASRQGGRLMGGISGRERFYRAFRAAAPGLAFAIGLAALQVEQLRIAQFCWLMIPPLFLLAEWFVKPRAPKAPSPAET